jgi:transposase
VSGTPAAGLDPQKKHLTASEQDPEQRRAWWEAMQALDPEHLVFVDETGSNITLTPRYGRAPRGQRCAGQVPRNWGHNTTLLAAMTVKGMQTACVIEGATDRAVFEGFVEHFLVPRLRPGQVVVWDNLSVHQSVRARELIEAAGCQVRFLPPYSPDFNPIEHAFAKLKGMVRQANQRTVEGLWTAIGGGLDQITAHDATGWFRHAGYSVGGQTL